MKRRNFIKNTSTLSATLPLLFNGLNIKAIPKSRLFDLMNLNNDKVLVLIQLQGGNDGLNTVIPLDKYEQLARLRPNVLIPENRVLKLDDLSGFHPAMSGMQQLFKEGQMQVVQSVGYPNQNRSHFRSTDIWTSGTAADEFDSRGWLGKYLDTQFFNYPTDFPNAATPHPIAITMDAILSETCQGISANYSLAINDPFGLSPLAQGEESMPPNTPYGNELTFLREAISQTNAYTEIITEIANKGANKVSYPDGNNLANQLKNVAILLDGGIQTKIFVCSIGGFDTHANQVQDGDVLSGIHNNLLQQVSEAISAFQKDISQLGLAERVIGMTFSEFGRQIASNQSFGTDHGTAAPLIIFGACVNPGFTGINPEIPVELAPQEGVAMQIDFRDVYGSILMDWFEVEEVDVKQLLFENFKHLPLVGNCQTTPTEEVFIDNRVKLQAFPNPFRHNITVLFESPKTHARLSVYDARGAEIMVVFDRRLEQGKHQFILELAHLAAGNYYIQLKSELIHETKLVVKIR